VFICYTCLQANLDNSNRAYWPIQVVNRWLSVRLEMMGAFIVFLTATCVTVIMPSNPGGWRASSIWCCIAVKDV
jgi:hypothetical protein